MRLGDEQGAVVSDLGWGIELHPGMALAHAREVPALMRAEVLDPYSVNRAAVAIVEFGDSRIGLRTTEAGHELLVR